MIVFWLAGHRPAAADLRKRVLLPRLISFLLLAVLGPHLTLTLRQTIAHSALQSAIRNTLSSELTKMPEELVILCVGDTRPNVRRGSRPSDIDGAGRRG